MHRMTVVKQKIVIVGGVLTIQGTKKWDFRLEWAKRWVEVPQTKTVSGAVVPAPGSANRRPAATCSLQSRGKRTVPDAAQGMSAVRASTGLLDRTISAVLQATVDRNR
jgi:hypothetical protein